MHHSFPQLTPEQRQAIAASGGLPVQFEDPETHKLYVVVAPPETLSLDRDYVNGQLSKGLAAIDAGQQVAWDPDKIKREGRERLSNAPADE